MRLLLICCLLLSVVRLHAGVVAEVTVGSDGACDYTSIMAASLNEPASDLLDIRVAKNVSLTSLQILDDRPTLIRGGYDTCSDTSPSDRTVLDGSGFSGPIFVAAEATSTTGLIDLFLLDLEITGGNSNTNGGVVGLTGSWYFRLVNVYMHDNVSNQDGGAIHIEPSANAAVQKPVLQIYGDSLINNNTADNGGAIACEGAGFISIWETQLALNEASQDGGAIYLNNGCDYNQYGGKILQGVLLNEAGGFGGGIYGGNGSLIEVNGSTFGLGLAAVISNSAANGGGIAVSGGSDLYVANASISDNDASSTGGGIRSNSSHVVIERTVPGAQCFSETRCSTISNNTALGTDPSFSGGGAIATFGGTLEIRGTYIENNNAQFGSAIRARFMQLDGLEHPITMVGNVIAENSGAPQVVYLDESSADIAFSTFVDNTGMSRVIEMAYPTTSSGPNEVRVSGSIFEHPGDTMPGVELTTSGQFVTADCNRYESSTTGDLPAGTRSTVNIPIFEDQAGGDYRLISGHSLLDWCDWSILGSESDVSANGYTRPVDDLSIGNLHGTYDLGALERYLPDVIFEDDFD
jgi:predicted outer membrane repeat protein